VTILAFNCGSSSLKASLFDVASVDGVLTERPLCSIAIDRIGGVSTVRTTGAGGDATSELVVADHATAVEIAFEQLDARMPSWLDELAAVGHRVVHGGSRFREAALLDGEATRYLDSLSELAPLHNAPALAAAARSGTIPGVQVPAVAVFDTAFHRTMPDRAAQYAIPHELTTRHEVYRYGFHGLAHRDMAEQFARLQRGSGGEQRIVTLQLGNGCSVTAVRDGRSIDTSMGFTPLEGLVMGTRSGDIDPTVVTYLARREGVTVEEIGRRLSTRSGLLGVSGISADVRDLLRAEADGDGRAALALEMFCYRARKYLGAYMAALGGIDGVVFGGGIGEHASSIRARICAGMEWAGLEIDSTRNLAPADTGGLITTDDSRVKGYVVRVQEERLIARETFTFLAGGRPPAPA